MSKLPVYEIFGPTIQGEGLYCGYRTVFLRLAGCDYKCSWCDTKHARRISDAREILSEEEIIERLNSRAEQITRRITITGGNPCIHELERLVELLHQQNYKIHIETQGSIIPPWLYKVDHVCISPKPPSSGNITEILSFADFMLSEISKELKVVVKTGEDYTYARQVHSEYKSCPLILQACTDNDPVLVLKWLIEKASADPCLGDNIKILPQLHALIGID
ncbi:MAG: radical SAM protein [Clostridiales bacterium]|nr:radical SAM protein [Clostridiales bacterium]MCF8022311.1 radical SAM protein [Clostridiales bacterium]